MKQIIYTCLSLVISMSLCAQNESELTESRLIFSNLADPFSGTTYGYNFFNIQSDFDVSSGAPGILSAGDDLQFSRLNRDGLLVTQTTVSDPVISSRLGLNSLSFSSDGSGANGSFWIMKTVAGTNGGNDLLIEETNVSTGAAYLSEALYIKSTGFSSFNNLIGIGTIDPTYKLDVEAGNTPAGVFDFNQVGVKRFYMPNWAPSGGQVIAGVFEGTTTTAPVTRYQSGSLFADIGMDVNANLIFETNDNVRMTIFQNGDVDVAGNLSKGGGSFKIDHPLDPENKYLYHSFVESPDMMNVYNGNITTDNNGEAIVTLPQYFEALNRDFRYQLTAVGTFAQLIIKEELANNTFVIASSEPNVKVSWQITGIRQDAYANKNRIPNEVDKKASEKGYYLHPEAFNQPISKKVKPERETVTQDMVDKAKANNDGTNAFKLK